MDTWGKRIPILHSVSFLAAVTCASNPLKGASKPDETQRLFSDKNQAEFGLCADSDPELSQRSFDGT
tara:strand:+ start:336 stop:536 length:201 start_codon:yes stop_codon:yes gene_type:complete